MKKTILITLVAALLIGVMSFGVLGATTQTPGPGQGPGQGMGQGPRNGQGFMNGLNLTLDQQQKMLAIRQEFERDTLALRNQMKQKMDELRKLWAAPTLDQGAINAKSNEVNALRIQMVAKQRALMDKMKAVLTPEQQKLLEQRGFQPGQGGRQGQGHGFRGGMMGKGFCR